jgi:hypothetical protein
VKRAEKGIFGCSPAFFHLILYSRESFIRVLFHVCTWLVVVPQRRLPRVWVFFSWGP